MRVSPSDLVLGRVILGESVHRVLGLRTDSVSASQKNLRSSAPPGRDARPHTVCSYSEMVRSSLL